MGWLNKIIGKKDQPANQDAGSPNTSALDKEAAEDKNAVPAEEADEVLPEDNRSLLLQLISANGLSMGGNLTNVTLPTFILEPRSLLEKLSDIIIHPELFTDIPKQPTKELRMKALVRWYISAYHVRPRGTKKPFNPVLGETFSAKLSAADREQCPNTMLWYAQQVSHHPPVSAFYTRDVEGSIVMQGCFAPKSKFLGNSAASMGGGAFRIYLPAHKEVYYLNWPNVYVRGVLFGTLLMEVCGNVVIQCLESNLTACVDFLAKGFFGGTHHQIAGAIFRGTKDDRKKGEQLYTVSGAWTGKTTVKSVADGTEEVLFDTAAFPLGKLDEDSTQATVDFNGSNADREEHNKVWPSRQTWSAVATAIKDADQEAATLSKQTVEQYQRDLRQVRTDKAQPYQPSLFKLVGEEVTAEWEYVGPDAVPLPSS